MTIEKRLKKLYELEQSILKDVSPKIIAAYNIAQTQIARQPLRIASVDRVTKTEGGTAIFSLVGVFAI